MNDDAEIFVVLDADIYTKPQELGYSLETTVFKHVKDYFAAENSLYSVGYIRDGAGAEIDVAVQYAGQGIQYSGNSNTVDTSGTHDYSVVKDYITISISIDGNEVPITVLKNGVPSSEDAFYPEAEGGKTNYYICLKGITEMPASYTVIYEIGFEDEYRHREIVSVEMK